MLRGYDGLPEIDRVIAEARDALGGEFIRLMNEGPAEALNQTVNTQPAMVTAGYAAYRAWRALQGPAPQLAAGHSLGEYTALVAAGALPRPGDAGGGARRQGRDGGDSGPGRGRRAPRVRGSPRRGPGRELQRARTGRDRRREAGGRQGDPALQVARREARDAAAGERALSFGADEARRRAAERLSRAGR